MILATELSAELFVDGRRRGQRAGEDLEWLAVNVEDLTFEDERFNYIVSSLGVQFAPRHEVSASELVRLLQASSEYFIILDLKHSFKPSHDAHRPVRLR